MIGLAKLQKSRTLESVAYYISITTTPYIASVLFVLQSILDSRLW